MRQNRGRPDRARSPQNLRLGLVGACLLLALQQAAVAAEDHARRDRYVETVHVNPDLTYTMEWDEDWTLLDRQGVGQHGRAVESFLAKVQTLDLVEAYVLNPDGRRIDVDARAVFTRPTAISRQGPGFTDLQETTVYFPQLAPGSRTHVRWRLRQTTPSIVGFSDWLVNDDTVRTDLQSLDIFIPAGIPLQWAQRGGFVVSDATENGIRHVSAVLKNSPARDPERSGVDRTDYRALFAATTMRSLDEIGAAIHRAGGSRAEPSPKIRDLAAEIAGGKTGLEAARAINDWVATHITYVAVFLSLDEGYVAHDPEQILANGYGDCKDHVALMQALLTALGIRSEVAVVQWGERYRPLPVPIPWQFNHAIIHLPDYDLYANPTDPYATFGMLDRHLAGKTVVLVNEAGGHAVLPPSRPEDYRYERTSTLWLGVNGTISGTARMEAGPGLAGYLRRDWEDAETILMARNEGGSASLDRPDRYDLAGSFLARANWSSPHLVPMTGAEVDFLLPGGVDLARMDPARNLLSPNRSRRSPLFVGAADYTWETELRFPSGYVLRRKPDDVEFRNAAGSYSASYVATSQGLTVRRQLVVAKDVFPPEEYPSAEALLVHALDDARAIIGLAKVEDATKAEADGAAAVESR